MAATFLYLQVFTVPLEQRRFKDDDENAFGDEGKQAEICKEIMAKTGNTLHLFLSPLL